LPSAGPTARDVRHQVVEDKRVQFDLVDVDDRVVNVLLAQPRESFRARFGTKGAPPPHPIGIGDHVVVSIWEAASGGLFTPSISEQLATGAHNVTIPDQVVGADGGITVPFAGRVPVAGRMPIAVQREIEKRLAPKAIEPQVLVTVAKSVANTVTVDGEVVNGARVPLTVNGDRLLDVIAEAGGAKAPVYQTFVRLSRGGVTARLPMEVLVANPAENIYARPGDVLTLVKLPQTFIALGATGANAQIPFTSETMNLIEGIAKAGGLQDARSDPAGVFLFRFEPPAVVKELGQSILPIGPGGTSPVVYRLNLRQAKSYFLAQRFPLEDKDIIFVANADLDELQKFFGLLNTVTGPVLTGIVVGNTIP
jgi:polysaccharide export outer membrane protein